MSTFNYGPPPTFKVMYPAGKTPYSEGRNGYLNTSGLQLKLERGEVEIRPITSRGHTASSCKICIPADRATVLALATQLQDIAMAL